MAKSTKPKDITEPENAQEEPETGGLTNVSELADGFVAGMPEVMPHVKQEAAPDTLPENIKPKNEAGGKTDSSGTVFDPSYHAVDDFGNPKLTKSGKFRKKTGAIKGLTNSAPQESVPQVDPEKCKALAKTVVPLVEFSAMQIAGPDCADEWAMNKFEREQLESSLSDYMISKGITDVPPGVALILAVGLYALPRFMSGTKTRAKIDAKIASLKPKKKEQIFNEALKEVSEIAYTDSGDNRDGQEYSG